MNPYTSEMINNKYIVWLVFFFFSLAVCHDAQQLRKRCFRDLDVFAFKWVKTGSVVEHFDSKRIVISFNTEFQETTRRMFNS